MQYEELYKESNELAAERFTLVMERIAEIVKETDVPAANSRVFTCCSRYS